MLRRALPRQTTPSVDYHPFKAEPICSYLAMTTTTCNHCQAQTQPTLEHLGMMSGSHSLIEVVVSLLQSIQFFLRVPAICTPFPYLQVAQLTSGTQRAPNDVHKDDGKRVA